MAQEEKEISNFYDNQIPFYSRAIEITVMILVIMLPLIFYPYLVRIFNPPKELVYELIVLFVFVLWMLKCISKDNKFLWMSSSLNIPVFGFILICILSLLWSDSLFVSLLELPLFLAGPFLYFVIINNIENHKQVHRILFAIIIIGSLMGIYGILQHQGIDFSFWAGNVSRQQVFGLFGNVNYFAEYLMIPLTIAVPLFFAARNKLVKIFLFIGIVVMGISLILTFTRSSYLGFAAALLFMIIFLIFQERKNFFKKYRKTIIYFLILTVIALMIFFIPSPLNQGGTVISKIKARTSITQLTQGSSILRRIAIWKFTWLMIKDHPILGSGLGNFQYNSLQYQAEFFGQGNNRALYPYGIADKAHNEYLQLWSELGIVGLLTFIWMIIQFFINAIRFLKREKRGQKQVLAILLGLMGAVITVLVDSLLGFPLHLPATISLFWLAIALTVVVVKKEAEAGTVQSSQNNKNVQQIKLDEKGKNHRFQLKYFLYPIIIIGTVLLTVMISRPFVAEVHEFYALRNIRSEDFNKAIKNYEKALKWNPYAGTVYFNVGQILSQRGIYTIALDYFEKAARFIDHPDLPEKLAYLYIRKGLTDKGIQKLEQAISYQEKEKDMIPLYSNLGKLYLQKKKYQEAERVFRKALEVDNSDSSSHLGLAVAQLNQGKKEEALLELKKVIELAPDRQDAQQARDLMQQIARENLEVN